jgi:hypothetical protein
MTGNLSRMSGALGRLDTSPRSVALRGLLALVVAGVVELGIVALANAAGWPAGAFYTVSALALAILIAALVPIIEPPRTQVSRKFAAPSDAAAAEGVRAAWAHWERLTTDIGAAVPRGSWTSYRDISAALRREVAAFRRNELRELSKQHAADWAAIAGAAAALAAYPARTAHRQKGPSAQREPDPQWQEHELSLNAKILTLFAEGRSMREIAEELGTTEAKIDVRTSFVLMRLNDELRAAYAGDEADVPPHAGDNS